MFCLTSNVASWNAADVVIWLKEKGLDDFKDIFYSSGFEGDSLLKLTGESFRGVKMPADRQEAMGVALQSLRGMATAYRSTSSLPSAIPASADADAHYAATALFDYHPVEIPGKPGKHISLQAGKRYTVLSSSKRWWRVRSETGEEGLAPSNFLSTENAPPPVPSRPTATAGDEDRPPPRPATGSSATLGRGARLTPPPLPSMRPRSSTTSTPRSSMTFDNLQNQVWFHSTIDRPTAEQLVRRNKPGSFLVRSSQSNPDDYTLTARGSDRVLNLKIRSVSEANFVLGEFGKYVNLVPATKTKTKKEGGGGGSQ